VRFAPGGSRNQTRAGSAFWGCPAEVVQTLYHNIDEMSELSAGRWIASRRCSRSLVSITLHASGIEGVGRFRHATGP